MRKHLKALQIFTKLLLVAGIIVGGILGLILLAEKYGEWVMVTFFCVLFASVIYAFIYSEIDDSPRSEE